MPTLPAPQVTPVTFAQSLLRTIGAPTTPANLSSLVAWQAREGGNWKNTAKANPLNTTEDAPGATPINSVGVKAYQSWNQGVNATAKTLQNGDYGDLLQAFKSGKGLSGELAGLSKWSGGEYSSVDGTVPVPKIAAAKQPARAAVVQQKVPDSVFQALGIGQGLPGPVRNLLYSKAQANLAPGHTASGLYSPKQGTLLTAHGDLQTLAGGTTLNTHPATGNGGQRLAAMVKTADSLIGKPYAWGGGHSSFSSPAYDCSGFVSAVLHAGGFLNAPQTTQTLPSQPTIASGPGKFVTVYDRTDASPSNDHVIIDLNGAWYESGGQSGPWGGGGGVQRIQEPSQQYLQSFNRQLHPLGL